MKIVIFATLGLICAAGSADAQQFSVDVFARRTIDRNA